MTSDVLRGVQRSTRGMEPEEALQYYADVIADLTPARSAYIGWRQRIPAITYQQAMILEVLWKRRPDVVSREAIYEALYAGRYGGDTPTNRVIDVQICKLREKLPAGVKVAPTWGVGYALTGYDVWEDQVADT